MLCLQMTCIHSKSPQQLHPLDPVALGLGIAPMDLSSVNAPSVDTKGVQITLQSSQHIGSLHTERDTSDNSLSVTAKTSTKDGRFVERTSAQLPAIESTSAEALGFQAELYSMLLSQQSQASSNVAFSLAQPQPKVSPYQSQPLCLPPRPRKSTPQVRDARKAPGNTKANATSGGSTKNAISHGVEQGGTNEEFVSL